MSELQWWMGSSDVLSFCKTPSILQGSLKRRAHISSCWPMAPASMVRKKAFRLKVQKSRRGEFKPKALKSQTRRNYYRCFQTSKMKWFELHVKEFTLGILGICMQNTEMKHLYLITFWEGTSYSLCWKNSNRTIRLVTWWFCLVENGSVVAIRIGLFTTEHL